MNRHRIDHSLKVFLTIIGLSAMISGCGTRSSETARERSGTGVMFELMPAESTGIDFSNNVVDGETFNVLTYRNFYNGGGVAIGDINNDSLPDVFFTSNQEDNRLYINKGDFNFEDITDRAGVGGNMAWSTGVTMADVNADGFLDIYVCNSGDVDGRQRKNELFINNGDLTFSERAAEYNLDNNGYSTHAAFFDYDADGDLDCYILNNSFKDPARIDLYNEVRKIPSPGGHKLMRNDRGVFVDVTTEAGIYSSDIAFGLGVAVSDLNGDNRPDIYVSNDFWERDYLYINMGNGKFSEELPARMNYCSTSSMGADIADLNGDGYPEIFTTDMLPADNYRLKTTIAFDPYHLEDLKYRANFHYQITQNCLHLNDGTARFSEIAFFSGVAATDWSWGALIFDFGNDGQQDIFVSNGILRDIMSMDFREFIADKEKRRTGVAGRRANEAQFISNMPAQPLKNYAFVGRGDLRFEDGADSLGLSEPSFSNGAAYGDLDNDGDLDIVVNNINAQAFVYRNHAVEKTENHYLKVRLKGPEENRFGIGAIVQVKSGGGKRVLQNFNTRGFQSSIEPNLLFGLGKDSVAEEVLVTWPDGRVQRQKSVSADRAVWFEHGNAVVPSIAAGNEEKDKSYTDATSRITPPAVHVENRYNDFDYEVLLARMLSTEGPRLIAGDVNKDGREDFVLPGASGDPDKLYVQQTDGSFAFRKVAAFANDAGFESTCGALFDHDNDGDLDLVIGAGGNEVAKDRGYFFLRYYRNDGKGNFSTDAATAPPALGNFSVIAPADVEGDGDVDLFVGARTVPGNYGLPPRSFLFINDNGTWQDVATQELGNAGMVTDAVWADIDNDRDPDLVVVGDWMEVKIFTNDKGILSGPQGVDGSRGWWNRVVAEDLDGNGTTDFVLGNWGLNMKFRAEKHQPLTMFVNDFDGNGKSEFIINWYAPMDSVSYPFATKPEITFQLPSLRKSILKYEDYGRMTYDSMFPAKVRESALRYDAEILESAILWNNGNSFELAPLPDAAQFAPVFAIVADDLNADGIKDLWLGGNFYALKPQVGRLDASRGVFLRGRGNRQFTPDDSSGIYVEGEVRDAIVLKGRKKRLLVARNNAAVILFE